MIKKWLEKINKEKLKVVLALIVLLQPIISLDYLAYDFLNQFNLPRIATVVHFLIIPLCILIGFLVFEHNRLRAFVLSFVYGFVVLIYFYFHTKNAILIRNDLYLPNNFQFSTFKELFYVLTLIIPYYLCLYLYPYPYPYLCLFLFDHLLFSFVRSEHISLQFSFVLVNKIYCIKIFTNFFFRIA
ncbi:MAG: hypothetical protein HGA35_04510 [Erysipelotrichaceae bacterium]|nr:hypothetical protein [Erysipelotrichaceae bacterium]